MGTSAYATDEIKLLKHPGRKMGPSHFDLARRKGECGTCVETCHSMAMEKGAAMGAVRLAPVQSWSRLGLVSRGGEIRTKNDAAKLKEQAATTRIDAPREGSPGRARSAGAHPHD